MKRFISFPGLTAICLGLCTLALVTSTAQAADGDTLSTIIADRTGTDCASFDADGNHSSVGVGIAFNGDYLLISCYSDNTITEIDPADGSQVAVHTIAGASDLGALAWDANSNQLWGCSNFNDVGIVDLTLDTFTYVFTSVSCFDGLGYDGTDDTIWSSGDVFPTTEHYTTAGALIAAFPNLALLGGTGNSGIAVGGPILYLANNGQQEIYAVQKDFSSSVLFASFPRRLEDMECDPITFASAGFGAIWNIDAYDNILNAYEISADACPFGGGGEDMLGRMTGGGSAFTADGTRVTHGFELHCDSGDLPNNLQVHMGKGKDMVKFHLTSLDSATCSDDANLDEGKPIANFTTMVGTGTGRCGKDDGATVEFTFTDAGEPGVDDTATILVTGCPGGASIAVAGALEHGNHQAHGD